MNSNQLSSSIEQISITIDSDEVWRFILKLCMKMSIRTNKTKQIHTFQSLNQANHPQYKPMVNSSESSVVLTNRWQCFVIVNHFQCRCLGLYLNNQRTCEQKRKTVKLQPAHIAFSCYLKSAVKRFLSSTIWLQKPHRTRWDNRIFRNYFHTIIKLFAERIYLERQKNVWFLVCNIMFCTLLFVSHWRFSFFKILVEVKFKMHWTNKLSLEICFH